MATEADLQRVIESTVRSLLQSFTGIGSPDASQNLTRWHQDDRNVVVQALDQKGLMHGMRSRAFRIKKASDSTQWLLALTDSGLVKMKIPDPSWIAFCTDSGLAFPELVELGTSADKLDLIKEVPWTKP